MSKAGPSEVVQIEMSCMDCLLSHKKDLEAMKQGGLFSRCSFLGTYRGDVSSDTMKDLPAFEKNKVPGDNNSGFSSLQLSEKPLALHSEIILSLFKAVITLGVCICRQWDSGTTKFEKHWLRVPQEWCIAFTILVCPLVASFMVSCYSGLLPLGCKQPLLNSVNI